MNRREQAALALTVLLFAAFPTVLGLANALMLLVLVLWVLSGRFVARWAAVRANPVVWCVLALYGLMLVGVVYTSAPLQDVKLHLSKYLKLLFVVVLASLLAESAQHRRWALHGFAAAMGFTMVSTWLNIWWQLPWSQSQTLGWGVSHHVFGDYITQNVMMAFFVLLALVRAMRSQPMGGRVFWGATALGAAISITHLSDGRTGYVLLVMALAVAVFTQIKGRTLLWATAVGVLLLGVGVLSSQTMRARFDLALTEVQQHDVNRTSSIGHRLYNYKTTPRLIAEKPLLGWGTGAYHTEICHVLDDPSQCPRYAWHPHNQYLFLAADHGLLGIAAYLALLFSMAWVAQRSADGEVRTLLWGLTVLLAVNSLFNSPLWSARESHFFVYMLALLASMAWASRQPARP